MPPIYRSDKISNFTIALRVHLYYTLAQPTGCSYKRTKSVSITSHLQESNPVKNGASETKNLPKHIQQYELR